MRFSEDRRVKIDLRHIGSFKSAADFFERSKGRGKKRAIGLMVGFVQERTF